MLASKNSGRPQRIRVFPVVVGVVAMVLAAALVTFFVVPDLRNTTQVTCVQIGSIGSLRATVLNDSGLPADGAEISGTVSVERGNGTMITPVYSLVVPASGTVNIQPSYDGKYSSVVTQGNRNYTVSVSVEPQQLVWITIRIPSGQSSSTVSTCTLQC
jgi:hypothetical protein